MTTKELHAKVPDYSCPNFDAAINEIETARGINSELREALETVLRELEEAEKYISELEQRTEDQQDTIEALRAELASKETP